jgi:hypothetical protein
VSCAQGRRAKVRKAHSLNRFVEKPNGYSNLRGVAGCVWMCLSPHRVTTKVTTVGALRTGSDGLGVLMACHALMCRISQR